MACASTPHNALTLTLQLQLFFGLAAQFTTYTTEFAANTGRICSATRTDKAQTTTQRNAWVVPVARVWQPIIVHIARDVVWVALSAAHKEVIA